MTYARVLCIFSSFLCIFSSKRTETFQKVVYLVGKQRGFEGLVQAENATKSIYILRIYIVRVMILAILGKNVMGILWEWYGNPMVRIAD